MTFRERQVRSCIRQENMGNVELATVSFGQSFQITPIQLATTVSSLINGGRRITPHFGVAVEDENGRSHSGTGISVVKTGILSEEDFRENPLYSGKSGVSQGSGQKCCDRRLYDRGKDSDFTDTSEKCKPIYLLVSWICTC